MVQNINKSIRDLLEEILIWVKFDGFYNLKILIEDKLPTDEERLSFELSDGYRSSRDIGRTIGVSHGTIQNWWEKWFKLGIVVPSKRLGRYEKVFSLKDVGIEISELKKR